jgi:GntR family transcriptional regulator/MocR family aminotransferase
LDSDNDNPMYQRVAEALRKLIEDGRLSASEKMPSVRDLAMSLGVSAATVGRAYDDLSARGYIKTVQGKGAVVADNPPHYTAVWHDTQGEETVSQETLRLSDYGLKVMSERFLRQSPVLNSGAPLIEDLAIKRWQDILAKCIKFDDPSLLAYEGDPLGYLPLREALAAYLLRARSVKCTPQQIAVFHQIEAGNDLICQLLIAPGDAVILEDPCYPARHRGFRVRGANVIPVPVDENGLMVQHLQDAPGNCRLVHVTPSHHDPSGVSLSISRRQALLAWAEKHGAFILENDFDCEYSYGAPYLPSLQGMDNNDCVIYRYTFWRALYPLVRMSILVLPRKLVPVVRRVRMFLGESPLLEQKALAEFIKDGHLDRHINRTRSIYEARRVALIQELTHCFQKLHISTAGMHLLVRFPLSYDADELLRCGKECGLMMADTRAYYHAMAPVPNEFIIGFAYHPSTEQIRESVARFAQRLKQRSNDSSVTCGQL